MLTRLIVAVVFVAASAASKAQDWAAAWFYDFGHKESSAVALSKRATIDRPFGIDTSLDVSAFAGQNLDERRVLGGVAVTKAFKAAEQVNIVLGLGATVQNERAIDWGGLLGVEFKARPVIFTLTPRSVGVLYTARF